MFSVIHSAIQRSAVASCCVFAINAFPTASWASSQVMPVNSQDVTQSQGQFQDPNHSQKSAPMASISDVYVQVALLLDTSNSMDGLIAQAKSQLWMLVNELGEGEMDGKKPIIELALYEYGNSNLSVSRGYIRQVLPLTSDLDAVSEQLFALKTDGGSEYAGMVIAEAVEKLEWRDNARNMKLVVIAGNEPFTQGPVDYKSACAMARKKDIIIDTIHCGDADIGIEGQWKAGADCGGGIYMTIDQDEETVYVPSPYDDDILRLNKALNETYYGFGTLGSENKERQRMQDSNAAQMSGKSSIARIKTKTSSQYSNATWDIVDAYEQDPDKILGMPEDALPEEMKNMSSEEKEAFIRQQADKRVSVKAELKSLEEQRSRYVSEKAQENAESQTLEEVLLRAVKSQAKNKGFSFKE